MKKDTTGLQLNIAVIMKRGYKMINELCLIIMLIGGALFIIITYLNSKLDESLYKAADESCYYCIYSTKPHAIRNRDKNNCKKINNRNWTSDQIRNCKYRVKK